MGHESDPFERIRKRELELALGALQHLQLIATRSNIPFNVGDLELVDEALERTRQIILGHSHEEVTDLLADEESYGPNPFSGQTD